MEAVVRFIVEVNSSNNPLNRSLLLGIYLALITLERLGTLGKEEYVMAMPVFCFLFVHSKIWRTRALSLSLSLSPSAIA